MYIDYNILKQKYNIITHGIIHVGMHEAEEYPIYRSVGDFPILFIEANERLAHSWKCDDENCYVVHAAISDKVEEVIFNISNTTASSSFLKLKDHSLIYPGIINIDSVKMKTATLDIILDKLDIYKFIWNVINLDIQGAELKAMKGLSDWSNIDAAFIEVNYRELYEGGALEPEVTEFLKSKGLVKVEEVDTGCGWGDALYIKS